MFETQIRCHPTPEHPKFEEYQFCLLRIWLFARDAKSAAAKAAELAKHLPYTLGPGKSFPIIEDENLTPGQAKCVEMTQIIGVNFGLHYWPKGTDEKAVFGDWPYLLPPLSLT